MTEATRRGVIPHQLNQVKMPLILTDTLENRVNVVDATLQHLKKVLSVLAQYPGDFSLSIFDTGALHQRFQSLWRDSTRKLATVNKGGEHNQTHVAESY